VASGCCTGEASTLPDMAIHLDYVVLSKIGTGFAFAAGSQFIGS